ncbi:hypothetical protein OHA25_38125 [Nonomuraea sp. NBC_00507]|uniref:hypothetical protein n=1 Tax=Nonomuraea sp. NBC_00507 TaxID=2976002 RepID=UPI002E19B992
MRRHFSIADRIIDGCAAVDALRHALHVVRQEQRYGATDAERPWLWLAFRVTPEPLAPELWDDVEWHLGNVFAKLGVSSRRHLRSVLSPPKPGTPRRGQQRTTHRV